MAKKIERRNSPIHGNGVFAKKNIAKGEDIVEYKGELMTHAKANRGYHKDIDTGHTFLFTLNEKWIINANRKGNVARWINHSCAPNAIAYVHGHKSKKLKQDRIIIEALRDIAKGEEITYDYGFEFDVPYTKELLAIWACRCGAPGCIGTMIKPKSEPATNTTPEPKTVSNTKVAAKTKTKTKTTAKSKAAAKTKTTAKSKPRAKKEVTPQVA